MQINLEGFFLSQSNLPISNTVILKRPDKTMRFVQTYGIMRIKIDIVPISY